MRRLALVVAGIALAAGLPAHAADTARRISLGNELVRRDWTVTQGVVTTTALVDRRTGRNWIGAARPSGEVLPSEWTYASVDVRPRELVFHYDGAGGAALVQDVVLRAHSAVFETTTT